MCLINKKALIEQLESHIYWGDSVIGLLEVAKNAPTIDAEPVRHGRWEWYEEPYDSRNPDGDYGWRCSCCKQDLENELVLGVPGLSHACAMLDNPDDPPTIMRCPNCGAKMGGAEGCTYSVSCTRTGVQNEKESARRICLGSGSGWRKQEEAWTMKTERQIANERHMKMVAEKLNGREYGHELDDHEEEQLKSVGLVVAFGYSDDNVEFRGAMFKEIGCWEDVTIPIINGEILKKCSDDCDDYDCPLWKDALSRAKIIRATFGSDGWKFYTDIPHEKFTIMEDGEVYGEGIVFAYEDVGGKCR